jgi:hypothetical protein
VEGGGPGGCGKHSAAVDLVTEPTLHLRGRHLYLQGGGICRGAFSLRFRYLLGLPFPDYVIVGTDPEPLSTVEICGWCLRKEISKQIKRKLDFTKIVSVPYF